MKEFTVNGLCIPEKHYMVDLSQRVQKIDRELIALGKYFTINRARQFGKTTTLRALDKALRPSHLVIRLSFEGFGSKVFSDESLFIATFITECAQQYALSGVEQTVIDAWMQNRMALTFPELRQKITALIESVGQDAILMIDEIDKSSNNQLFLDFLGMLRDMYLRREDIGTLAFKSVILAGVYDIKNLKLKIRPEEGHKQNSPWNIATDFNIDMSFSASQIAGMLSEYEADHHTGMDVPAIAQAIYGQTSGYPFLVSALCKCLDEDIHDWTLKGLQLAVSRLLRQTNTLFDDIIKNVENNLEFRALLEALLLKGEKLAYVSSDTRIALGVMFGILRPVGNDVQVANPIFEQYLYEHFISMRRTDFHFTAGSQEPSEYAQNGILDMQRVLNRFSAVMKSEFRSKNAHFIEEYARLLFLIFLKPIINGTGHYAVEAQTRDSTRMDVLVFYGKEEYIVELKLWHGKKHETEAYTQLAGYLDARGQRKGYLVCFCNLNMPPQRPGWITVGDKKIYEEIIEYGQIEIQ